MTQAIVPPKQRLALIDAAKEVNIHANRLHDLLRQYHIPFDRESGAVLRVDRSDLWSMVAKLNPGDDAFKRGVTRGIVGTCQICKKPCVFQGMLETPPNPVLLCRPCELNPPIGRPTEGDLQALVSIIKQAATLQEPFSTLDAVCAARAKAPFHRPGRPINCTELQHYIEALVNLGVLRLITVPRPPGARGNWNESRYELVGKTGPIEEEKPMPDSTNGIPHADGYGEGVGVVVVRPTKAEPTGTISAPPLSRNPAIAPLRVALEAIGNAFDDLKAELKNRPAPEPAAPTGDPRRLQNAEQSLSVLERRLSDIEATVNGMKKLCQDLSARSFDFATGEQVGVVKTRVERLEKFQSKIASDLGVTE